MEKRYLIIFLTLLITICTVTAVSAENQTTHDISEKVTTNEAITNKNIETDTTHTTPNINKKNNTNSIKNAGTYTHDVNSYTELADAFNNAKSNSYDEYTINLLPGDYTSTNEILFSGSQTKNIKINGNGLTIDGNTNNFRFITVNTGHTLSINNVTFQNFKNEINRTTSTTIYGGVIYATGTLNLSNCIFKDNCLILKVNTTSTSSTTAYAYGGAVGSTTKTIIENCEFINNSIKSSLYHRATTTKGNNYPTGGAVYLKGNAVINNITLSENNLIIGTDKTYTNYRGSAIAVEAHLNMTNANISNHHIEKNNTYGALWTNGVNNIINIKDSIFDNNTHKASTGYSSAIYSQSKLNLSNVTISNNKGHESAGIYHNTIANITLNDVKFINNSAFRGGALFLANGFTRADNLTFRDNYAEFDGGALCTNAQGKLYLTNSVFINNVANHSGGAVYANSVNSSIDNCNFTNNTAYFRGGAIIHNQYNMTVNNSYFTENSAFEGGAIYETRKTDSKYNGTLNLYNSVFTHNKGNTGDQTGGGSAIFNAGNINPENLEFNDNPGNYYYNFDFDDESYIIYNLESGIQKYYYEYNGTNYTGYCLDRNYKTPTYNYNYSMRILPNLHDNSKYDEINKTKLYETIIYLTLITDEYYGQKYNVTYNSSINRFVIWELMDCGYIGLSDDYNQTENYLTLSETYQKSADIAYYVKKLVEDGLIIGQTYNDGSYKIYTQNGTILSFNLLYPREIEPWGTLNQRFVVYNETEDEEYVNISVKKVWDDFNNKDNKRPSNITVRLYANNAVTNRTIVLNENNNWNYTFTNLRKHSVNESGIPEIINYSIYELDSDNNAIPNNTSKNEYTVTYTNVSNVKWTINNKYDPLINITGHKTWIDGGRTHDNTREVKLVLQRKTGDNPYETVTATPAWTSNSYKYTHLAKYDANGHLYQYRVREEQVNGYAAPEYDGYNITNTISQEYHGLSVTKVWNDHDNQDGKRNQSIRVILYYNGEEYMEATLSSRNNWTYTFKDLPKYDNGHIIRYTVDEVGVPQGYTKTTTGNQQTGFFITNTYTPEVVSISVLKEWADKGNQDGIRPDSITVQLYADGVAYGSVRILNNTNHWRTSFNNLPKYNKGTLVNYSVDETRIPSGYTKNITRVGNEYIILNTHTPRLVNVTIHKVWNDNSNQDGIRPDNIQLQLLGDGEVIENITLKGRTNTWSHTFRNLPVYYDGNPITYTVNEVTHTSGYTVSYNGLTVTNTHKPSVTQIEVNKQWADHHNMDGIRPESVKVQLLANGVVIRNITLSNANNWRYIADNLPVNQNGTDIVYTVDEKEVPAGYTKQVNMYTILNTHTPEVTSLTVTKVWNDNDNQDNKRPDRISIEVYLDGELYLENITLGSANNWTYTVANLPKYYDGRIINYTVDEVGVPEGYTKSYTHTSHEHTITNTYHPEVVQVDVIKDWEDQYNQDGIRPNSTSVQLYADGEALGNPVVLSQANDWRYSFTNLDKYNNDNIINYTIDEINVPRKYSKEVITLMANEFKIINHYIPETVNITVNKIWEDNNNQDGIRPNSIMLELLADGEVIENITLHGTGNNWTYTVTNLPKYYDGKLITYTLEEKHVTNYTVSYNGYTVTNTHIPEVTQVEVMKQWDDHHNSDGIRPSSVKVQLYADGVKYKDSMILSQENNWMYLFNNLPKYNNGIKINYTVDEISTPRGYAKHVYEYIIINSHTSKTKELTVHKVWNDNNNQDGIRPTSVEVILLSNDEEYARITLNNKNNWTYTFKELPAYHNRVLINYTIDEVSNQTSYTKTIKDYTIINSYTPQVVQVDVIKDWEDQYDQDGIRPNSVKVQLYANGRKIGESIVLNSENQWRHSFTQLPKYDDGKLIQYTVKEISSIKGYVKTIEKIMVNEFRIINTHTPEKINITINKVWKDNDNQDGIRPNSVKVQLYANGRKIKTITLNKNNKWTYTIKNLPKYTNGKTIKYTIQETQTPTGYTATTHKQEITNTHIPYTTNVSVRKVWNDNNNQNNSRPDNIIIELYANNNKINNITLNNMNNWTYTFKNLPKNNDGSMIIYTIHEISVENYNTSITGNQETSFTVTNTIIPKPSPVHFKWGWELVNMSRYWQLYGENASYPPTSDMQIINNTTSTNTTPNNNNNPNNYNNNPNINNDYNNQGIGNRQYLSSYWNNNNYYRYSGYNRYSRYNRYPYTRISWNNGLNPNMYPYSARGNIPVYQLYIYLYQEYLLGHMSYSDFVAALERVGIDVIHHHTHWDNNGTLIIDYEDIDDVPDVIRLENSEDHVKHSHDTVDKTGQSSDDYVIDSGEIEAEVNVDHPHYSAHGSSSSNSDSSENSYTSEES